MNEISTTPEPQRVSESPAPTAKVPAVRRSWLGALTVLAVLGAAAIWWRTTGGTPAQYVTAPASRGSVVRTVTASGTVNPVVTVQVGTYVSGVIQTLYCDYNTLVKKGQLCAKIDPRPYQTAVNQVQASLATAKASLNKDIANLDYMKLTYDRSRELHAQDLVSQDTVDNAKNAFDQASAQLEFDRATIDQHRAALDAANVNLGYTDIVSPVDGTVVSRNVTIGQTVAASFQTPTLFLIAGDLTRMEVDTNVSESDIGGIRPGDKASFSVEAFPAHTFDGEVTEVRQAPQSVQNVVTYDVVVAVANPDLLLKPGMTATTRLVITRRDDVLRVPDQALRYTPGGIAAGSAANRGLAQAEDQAQVWVLRDGQPARVPVTVGLNDDTNTEIVQGALAPDDRVIVSERVAQSARKPAAATAEPRFRL